MIPKKKKILKIGVILLIAGLLIGGGTVLYMFNMPHRNVQSASTDFSLSASQLVAEYLENPAESNEKYLANDGESKVLEIKGTVAKISEDFKGQKVVLLKGTSDKAGVSCTFTKETNENISNTRVGEIVTIKGVIRLGASFDSDLEMYENVVLEKSDLVK
ncbi:OB-fold protein [Labilibaculum antarcticum]|uniref:tRNA_anti-like n=1 Tax=Labilibaculum antarcticum TaxID=1717717 RepID=A0A1Y1CP85_9BACT|nr:hypothetical protein [Labilibaculum antarcticum]BAX81762.1 hypothetical protein ALGA_3464 [Labilibaculum antarcticum]